MSPDGAYFLATDGLPNILTVLDVPAGEQHRAIRRDDLLGNGWRGVINFPAVIAEKQE